MLDKIKNRINSFKTIPGRMKSTFDPDKLNTLIRKRSVQVWSGVVVVLIIALALFGIWVSQQVPSQPIQFPHFRHVGFGVQCLYCHPGAWKGPSAGLPTETKCFGCHQQISLRNTELNKLFAYIQAQEPIPWVPVFILPDFVFFNHRPHIAAGVNCETCHGELSTMVVAQPRKLFNMGFCLSCHRTRFANDTVAYTRLTDCGTCHR